MENNFGNSSYQNNGYEEMNNGEESNSFNEYQEQSSYSHSSDGGNFPSNENGSYGQEEILPPEEDKSEVEDNSEPADLVDSVEEELNSIPNNAKTEETFSEKDVYKIINLITVFEHLEEEEKKTVDTLLSIGGSDIKRSMSIVKMDYAEFSEKRKPVSFAGLITDIVDDEKNGKGGNVFDKIINCMRYVEDSTEDEKNGINTFVRKAIKSTGSKVSYKANRNTSNGAIIENVREIMKNEEAIYNFVKRMNSVFKAVDIALN